MNFVVVYILLNYLIHFFVYYLLLWNLMLFTFQNTMVIQNTQNVCILFTSFSEVFMSTEYMPIPQDSKMAKRFWSMVKGLILTIILLSIMWLVYSDVQQHGGTFLHRRCFKAIGNEFFSTFFFKIRLH